MILYFYLLLFCLFQMLATYLHLLLHVINWSIVLRLTANLVVDGKEHNQEPIDDDVPVHATRSGFGRRREEHHHPGQEQETHSNAIAHESKLAQVESSRWELLASNALRKYAGHGQEVG